MSMLMLANSEYVTTRWGWGEIKKRVACFSFSMKKDKLGI